MKAVNKNAGKLKREQQEREAIEESFGGDLGEMEDGIVLVMLAKETWDVVQEMAERTNSSTADVIAGSLQLAYKKLGEVNGS